MASSKIATAYVQVMPSMDGVAPKVKSFFGSAGSSSGSLFGANFGSMIKNALVSAGIGTAIKETILEGADLQQSLGGIDTLFKDSAETVKASAANAYKTAGLSANEYMESVTSFSASLIKSLGDDTAKAAEAADMALTDMSDNANKMGSSMESIQNAYQGFAKQNYTMLDNLKLGYGGTKSEMQRLLKDAQKLTGVKYDINNLSDVYAAIHAVQEELGITGATAAEASTTLTGSFNAMKAASSNVLGNLTLGNDIKPSLVALADTTKIFLMDNLVPAVTNIITALPRACVTFVNALIPQNVGNVIQTITSNVTSFISKDIPYYIKSGAETIGGIITGFLSGLPELLSDAGTMMKELLGAIAAALPSMCSTGLSLIGQLIIGLLNNLPNIISAGASLVGSLLSELGSYLPEMLSQGMDMILQLIAGVILAVPDFLVEMGKLCDDAIAAIKEVNWEQVGSDIIEFIKSGISAAWGKLTEWFNELWNGLVGNLNVNVNVNNSGGSRVGGKNTVFMPHAKGLDYVPYDGYLAELHKGEMVLTSKQADAVRGGNLPGRNVVVNQYIYSEAKTSADLMREARYQQELAVMMNV